MPAIILWALEMSIASDQNGKSTGSGGEVVGDGAGELTGTGYRALWATKRARLGRWESLSEVGSHWQVLNGGVT